MSLKSKACAKEFDGFALQNLSLAVEEGTITGLVGANGAGKSTTLELILNLIRRDAGTIRVFGLDNREHEREIKQQIGVVFDEPCFHELLTPRQIDGYMGARCTARGTPFLPAAARTLFPAGEEGGQGIFPRYEDEAVHRGGDGPPSPLAFAG